MKKLCFVTTIPLTVRAFVIPVVRYLAENTDWEITVVCDTDPTLQAELPERVRYVPVPMKRGISPSGLSSVWQLYSLFRKEKFDLVQYSTPNASFYSAIASWLAGIRHRKYHLMGFRYLGFTGVKKTIFKTIERLSCLLSTDIECVSPSNMTLGVREKVFPAEKAHVVFFGSSAGVDLERFDIHKRSAWRAEMRDRMGYTEDQCVFGFAGRITGDKGINELLNAFSKISSSENQLLLVGSIERDGLNPGLLDQAEKSKNITFLPFVDDIERCFAAMDVLVLPSYREGFGNVIIEAQAMGLPVIVTDIPGPVDAMIPGETGLVVPAADVEALADAMQQMDHDAELRARCGAQGRKLAEERFDFRKLMEHFLRERQDLLQD